MQRSIERLRRWVVGTPRLFAVALAAIVLATSLFSMVLTLDVVTVTDSKGGEHTLLTASRKPEEIIQMVGITTTKHDEIVYTEHSENTASVVINRAFTVAVQADGQTLTQEMVEGTVAELLALSNVQLGEHDFVEPALHTPLEENMQVLVHRVTFGEEALRTEIAPEDVAAFKEKLLAENPDSEFKESKNGMYDVTYNNRYVNGALESKEIQSLVAVVQPRDAGSTAFVNGVPCSTIESFEGITMGPEGIPNEYTSVMEGAVATAYSSSGGRGSSGLGLYCGTVAVNPNVIPYGTRLYITSADNSFVYGYAIATDTGGALMDGRVDIDLYFETNAECLRFGKRALNVYVLD